MLYNGTIELLKNLKLPNLNVIEESLCPQEAGFDWPEVLKIYLTSLCIDDKTVVRWDEGAHAHARPDDPYWRAICIRPWVFKDDYYRDTILFHEYAHILVSVDSFYEIRKYGTLNGWGKTGHGKLWRDTMVNRLGRSPNEVLSYKYD